MKTLTALFALIICLATLPVHSGLTTYPHREVSMLEILFLHKGKTREEAEDFLARLTELSQEYGSTNNAGVYVKKWMKGGSDGIYNADFVVVSTFPNAQKMNDMLQHDETYAELAYEKDEIFDSRKTIIFMVDPMEPPR